MDVVLRSTPRKSGGHRRGEQPGELDEIRHRMLREAVPLRERFHQRSNEIKSGKGRSTLSVFSRFRGKV